ncbi:hypothetical protein Tco_1268263 [Tanacetum coccineum]
MVRSQLVLPGILYAVGQKLVLSDIELVLPGKLSTAELPLEEVLLGILDFLTSSSINFALIVSPTIYASYIEQFWNTACLKTINSEKQIHANVDGKVVVVSESSVRRDLHLNDEDCTACLTNNEIFENLALMGYEPASDKLTFYKCLFSPQWKYLIHTILHCLSSKSTSWDQFSTNLASAIICLAKGQKFNFSKLIFFNGMLRNLDPKKFLMYPRFLQLFLNVQLPNLVIPFNDIHETPKLTNKVFTNMRKSGKGFSGRVTPLFQNMLVPPVVVGEGSEQPLETQPTPFTAPLEDLSQVTTPAASRPSKDPNTNRRTKRGRNTKVSQSGGSPNKVGDEAINEEMFDSVERAVTTASSLEAEQASGNINKTQTTAMPNVDIPQGMDTGGSPRHQETIRGAPAQTRSERVLEKSNEPPLPEGHTSRSGEGSMEHTFELMDNVPNTPHDSPLTGGYTPGSDEGRLKLEELITMCTKLSKQVLDLEKEKDAQAVEILKLNKRVKKLERKRKSSISHPRKRIYRQVESSNDDLDEEDASKQGTNSEKTKPMFKDNDFDVLDDAMEDVDATPVTPPIIRTVFDDDEDLTIAQTLVKMRSEKAKEKGVAFKDVEETPRVIRSITTLQPLPTIDPKDKGKGILQETESMEKTKNKVQGDAQIERDAEVALRLQEKLDEELRVERERQEEAFKVAIAKMFDEVQARMDVDYELATRMTQEEQEKYTIEERARLLAEFFERRKKQLAAERAEAIRNKPPTKTQLRNLIMTYLKNMGGYKHSQLKGKSYEEIHGLYERQQKRIQDFTPMDSEKEAQKPGKRLKRVAGSYATQKSPKKPKVMKSAKDVIEEEATEYETHKEELRLSFKIISNDDSEVNYEPLSRKFPTMKYQLLGKMEEKDMYVYKLTIADGSLSYHGDTQAFLRRLDRQDLNDLYSCGVHTLFMDGTSMEINMLVEKKYSLVKELLEKMLNLRLEAKEESTVAFELIKFIKSLLEE